MYRLAIQILHDVSKMLTELCIMHVVNYSLNLKSIAYMKGCTIQNKKKHDN